MGLPEIPDYCDLGKKYIFLLPQTRQILEISYQYHVYLIFTYALRLKTRQASSGIIVINSLTSNSEKFSS